MEKGDDPYKILEVGKTASETEIKKSYRKLALKHHPDRQQDAAAKEKAQHIFAKISAAYEVLSDEKKRKEYDSLQKEQKSNSKSGCARGFDSRKMDVVFNDPYEVWKRDFEDQWGFAYPGAAWDFSEGAKKNEKKRITYQAPDSSDSDSGSSDSDSKGSVSSDEDSSDSSSSSDDSSSSESTNDGQQQDGKPKRRSFLGALVPFRGKKDKTEDSAKKSPKVDKKSKKASKSSSTAIVPHKGSTALAKKNKSKKKAHAENRLVVSNGLEGDNRPVSMETSTEKIRHPDGTVEKLTTTKITRPDGSVETIKMSDRAEKRKDWRKPEKKKTNHLQLTNGEAPRKQITDGGKKKPLAITDGKKKVSKSSTKSSKSTAIVVKKDKKKKK